MGRTILASNELVVGTTIQVPSTGYHRMQESVSIESVVAFIDVLDKLSHN